MVYDPQAPSEFRGAASFSDAHIQSTDPRPYFDWFTGEQGDAMNRRKVSSRGVYKDGT